MGETMWNVRRNTACRSMLRSRGGHSPNSVPRHFASMPLSNIYVVAARITRTRAIPVEANRRSRSIVKDRMVRPKSGSMDITLKRASTPGSNKNEFVRRPVRYAVTTTMYTDVTRTMGIASHNRRVSELSHAMIPTNPTPTQVVRSRKEITLARMTWGTDTGNGAKYAVASTCVSECYRMT